MAFPKEKVPEEFLKAAEKLISRSSITERDFIDLCLLAVKLIDTGHTTMLGRNNMSLYITNLWFRHDNISGISLLSEIGGQFGEWEIPGYFGLNDENSIRRWTDLKKWIAEADERYKRK